MMQAQLLQIRQNACHLCLSPGPMLYSAIHATAHARYHSLLHQPSRPPCSCCITVSSQVIACCVVVQHTHDLQVPVAAGNGGAAAGHRDGLLQSGQSECHACTQAGAASRGTPLNWLEHATALQPEKTRSKLNIWITCLYCPCTGRQDTLAA